MIELSPVSLEDQERHYERYQAAQRKRFLSSLETDTDYEILKKKVTDLDKILAGFLDELVIARPMHKRADRIQRLLGEIKNQVVPDLTNQKI